MIQKWHSCFALQILRPVYTIRDMNGSCFCWISIFWGSNIICQQDLCMIVHFRPLFSWNLCSTKTTQQVLASLIIIYWVTRNTQGSQKPSMWTPHQIMPQIQIPPRLSSWSCIQYGRGKPKMFQSHAELRWLLIPGPCNPFHLMCKGQTDKRAKKLLPQQKMVGDDLQAQLISHSLWGSLQASCKRTAKTRMRWIASGEKSSTNWSWFSLQKKPSPFPCIWRCCPWFGRYPVMRTIAILDPQRSLLQFCPLAPCEKTKAKTSFSTWYKTNLVTWLSTVGDGSARWGAWLVGWLVGCLVGQWSRLLFSFCQSPKAN